MKNGALPRTENSSENLVSNVEATTILQENLNRNSEHSLKRKREENPMDESEIVKKLKLELEKNINANNKLKAEKLALQKARSQDKKTIAKLKTENKELKNQVGHDGCTQTSNELIRSLASNSNRKPNGRRWTVRDKSVAITGHYLGPACYKFMSKNYGLPSVTTIRRNLQAMKFETGICKNVMRLLKLKASLITDPAEKLVTIVHDEIQLESHIKYCTSNDLFHGIDHKKGLPINNCLMFMIRGIKHSWKQIVGIFLSHGAIKGEELDVLLKLVFEEVFKTGFIVKAASCDLSKTNQSLLKLNGISLEKPYFEVKRNDGTLEKVYWFYDPSHGIKGLRNNL